MRIAMTWFCVTLLLLGCSKQPKPDHVPPELTPAAEEVTTPEPAPEDVTSESSDTVLSPQLAAMLVGAEDPEATRQKIAAAAAKKGMSIDEFLTWLEGIVDPDRPVPPPRPPKPQPVPPQPVPTPQPQPKPQPNPWASRITFNPETPVFGRVVAVTLRDLPPKPHYARFNWEPTYPEDFKLELTDPEGNPLVIFESTKPGTRTIELITAVNGDPIPLVAFDRKYLYYGEDGDKPNPPDPDKPEPPPAPHEELKAIVMPIKRIMADVRDDWALQVSAFFMSVADTVDRSQEIKTTQDLRTFLQKAETNAFANTPIAGAITGLSKAINDGYGEYVGLEIAPLGVEKRRMSVEYFKAVAWATFPKG